MRTKSVTEKNSTPAIVCTAPWRLFKVKPLPNYIIEVQFIDGTCGFVDLSKRVMSETAGIFAVLKDKYLFNQVHIEQGVVTWPGEIDLAPDAMYDEIKRNSEWVLK